MTYTPLTVTGDNSGTTIQPNGTVYAKTPNDPIINGTSFVVITSKDLYVTPYNISLVNDFVVAGPAVGGPPSTVFWKLSADTLSIFGIFRSTRRHRCLHGLF